MSQHKIYSLFPQKHDKLYLECKLKDTRLKMNEKNERREISKIIQSTEKEIHPKNRGWYYEIMLHIILRYDNWTEALEEVKTRSKGFIIKDASTP